MATKNEKTLAQAICGIMDLLSLIKPQISEALDARTDELWAESIECQESGKIPDEVAPLYDLLSNDNPIRKMAEAILNEEESATLPVKGASALRFGYTGLDIPTMTQEQRDKMGVCEFTVSYGGKLVLEIYWDPTLQWILQPNEDKTEFKPVAKRACPGQGAKFKGSLTNFLRGLGEEELVNPGSFAKKYYVTAPTVFVRR